MSQTEVWRLVRWASIAGRWVESYGRGEFLSMNVPEGITVIDNAISEEDFLGIKNILANPSFPWDGKYGIVSESDDKKQYVHSVYDAFCPRSNLFFHLAPLFFVLQPRAFIRIKANKMLRTEAPYLPEFHIDFRDCVTAIYYLDTTNGNTVFKTGGEIQSVGNRLIIFDSNLEHTGYTCTDKESRTVINFNFFRRNVDEAVRP